MLSHYFIGTRESVDISHRGRDGEWRHIRMTVRRERAIDDWPLIVTFQPLEAGQFEVLKGAPGEGDEDGFPWHLISHAGEVMRTKACYPRRRGSDSRVYIIMDSSQRWRFKWENFRDPLINGRERRRDMNEQYRRALAHRDREG